MELLLKIGGSQDPKHWRDGQIIDIRPDGFHTGRLTRKHHCVLTMPGDYWQLRGSTNWKWPGQKVFNNIQKYLVAVDSQGKYPWERTVELDEKRLRRRDWFFDFKLLFDLGLITETQFDAIYDKKKDPGTIYIERALDQLVRHEDIHQRLSSKYSLSKGTISAGTYSIGSGLDYETVTAFEADIIEPGTGPLTGNLTGEHANEETAFSSTIYFDVDTDSYLLKLTAAAGAEHNGGAYGNGARINYPGYGYIVFSESIEDTFDDLEVSKLALDVSGNNTGLSLSYGSSNGLWTVNRCLLKGDSGVNNGINIALGTVNSQVTNNIVYGVTDSAQQAAGIKFRTEANTSVICNNTCIGCYNGFRQDDDSYRGALTFKNNLAQGNSNKDYEDDGGGFGTHAYNISEDATSPDESYRSKDLHTNTIFKDYGSNDYRLDSEGDATNLAIADDGEDLSGTFTDDIEGQTRSTWYIGASEIVAGGTTYQATAADGMQLGETLARQATFPVFIADGLSAGDIPYKIATLLSQAADGATLSDASSVITTLMVTITDGAVIGDSPAVRANFQGNIIDGLTLGETLSVTALFIALSQDGALFGDTAAWKAAIEALATDGFIGSDSVTTLLTALATATDGVTLSETLAWQLTSIIEAVDGMTLGDTGTLQATFRVQATDAATFSDSVSRIVTLAALATDGFTIGDVTMYILATGEVSITFTTKKATIRFLVKAPGISFDPKKPEITFH